MHEADGLPLGCGAKLLQRGDLSLSHPIYLAPSGPSRHARRAPRLHNACSGCKHLDHERAAAACQPCRFQPPPASPSARPPALARSSLARHAIMLRASSSSPPAVGAPDRLPDWAAAAVAGASSGGRPGLIPAACQPYRLRRRGSCAWLLADSRQWPRLLRMPGA